MRSRASLGSVMWLAYSHYICFSIEANEGKCIGLTEIDEAVADNLGPWCMRRNTLMHTCC